jgi:hypothetical protein
MPTFAENSGACPLNENTLIVKCISEGPLFGNENSSADEVEVLVTNGW